MDQGEKLRKSVTSALIYPAILVVTAVGSIILLMTVVIPRFEPLFRDAGEELPLMTRIFMTASEVTIDNGPVILLVSLLVLIAIRRKRQRSEEHTSELQSLMRTSYAVFCLKKKNKYLTN